MALVVRDSNNLAINQYNGTSGTRGRIESRRARLNETTGTFELDDRDRTLPANLNRALDRAFDENPNLTRLSIRAQRNNRPPTENLRTITWSERDTMAINTSYQSVEAQRHSWSSHSRPSRGIETTAVRFENTTKAVISYKILSLPPSQSHRHTSSATRPRSSRTPSTSLSSSSGRTSRTPSSGSSTAFSVMSAPTRSTRSTPSSTSDWSSGRRSTRY